MSHSLADLGIVVLGDGVLLSFVNRFLGYIKPRLLVPKFVRCGLLVWKRIVVGFQEVFHSSGLGIVRACRTIVGTGVFVLVVLLVSHQVYVTHRL